MNSTINNIIEDLEESYNCVFTNKKTFLTNLFEMCCEISEYEGIHSTQSPKYIETLMEEHLYSMYDDVKFAYERNNQQIFHLDLKQDRVKELAWKIYLERK